MRIILLLITTCFLILANQVVIAQVAGDYRSAGSGTWDEVAWEYYNGTTWVGPAAAPDNTAGQINIKNGNTVRLDAPATADQLVVDAGGSLVIDAGSGLTLTDGAGEDLIIKGIVSIINGGLLGPGVTLVDVGGKLIFNEASASVIGGLIINNGTIDWMNGDIYCIADTTIVNNSVFNIRGNNMIRFSSSSAGSEFINNGTINKESSDTTEFILGDIFTNKGIINLNSGTVITRNVFTNTGSLVFNTGYFIIENTFNHNGGSITGTGHFINSSRLTLNTDQEFPATLVFTMDPTGSTVDGSGNLILNQDFTIVGSVSGAGILAVHGNTWWNSNTLGRRFIVEAGKTLTLATPSSKSSADLITNNGTIDWMDGDIYCIADTLIINNSVFNIRGNNTIHFSSSSAGSEFINNGTINKESSGTTEFILGDIFTNSLSGIIKGNGTINMNCPTFINNGVIAPGLSPGILEFDTHQPFSANSTLQIEMQNGAGAGIGHDQLIRNSNLALAGTLTVTETGTVPNGTYTIISLTAGSLSNTFSTVNLPIGYTLITNTDNIQLKKDLVVTPVKLISFTAALQNNIVLLHWVTENELNNKYFDIERGINGTDFVSIGRTGASTATAGRKEYSFTDQQPLSGINYYRLKQVDIDGRFEYSPVAKATIDGQENFMTIYPNPVKDLFQIGFNKINPIVQVSIIDTQGRQLISRQISNQSLLQLPVQNLAPGIYYIKATDGSKTVALPFLKK